MCNKRVTFFDHKIYYYQQKQQLNFKINTLLLFNQFSHFADKTFYNVFNNLKITYN